MHFLHSVLPPQRAFFNSQSKLYVVPYNNMRIGVSELILVRAIQLQQFSVAAFSGWCKNAFAMFAYGGHNTFRSDIPHWHLRSFREFSRRSESTELKVKCGTMSEEELSATHSKKQQCWRMLKGRLSCDLTAFLVAVHLVSIKTLVSIRSG